MVGIERIDILNKTSGRGAWRFIWARDHWSEADKLYHDIFEELDMPLLPGSEYIECSYDAFEAGYDHALGIDVLLRFESGMTATLQEKFLSYHRSTITVEYMQNATTGEQGDWFNLKCQYYFVGYDRSGSKEAYERLRTLRAIRQAGYDDSLTFNDWMMCDWPAMMRATQQGRLRWYERSNRHDGAKANFKWTEFNRVPDECAIARYDARKVLQPSLW